MVIDGLQIRRRRRGGRAILFLVPFGDGGESVLHRALGGFLVDALGWRSVFLVNLPVVALTLVGGAIVMVESRDRSSRLPDPLSALVSRAPSVSPAKPWARMTWRSAWS